MNIVLAFLLLVAIFLGWGVYDGTSDRDRGASTRRRAPRQVLQPGDRVVAVDGKRGDTDDAARADRHAPLRRRAGRRLQGGRAGAHHRRPRRARADVHDHARLRGRRQAPAASASPAAAKSRGRRRRRGRRAERRGRCGSSRRGPSRRSPGSSRPRSASRSRASSAPTRRRARRSTSAPTARCSCSRVISLSLGDHQPVPVPAARRRPHLLGAGREGARPGDPVQRDGARRLRRLRARDRAVHGRADERHRPA